MKVIIASSSLVKLKVAGFARIQTARSGIRQNSDDYSAGRKSGRHPLRGKLWIVLSIVPSIG